MFDSILGQLTHNRENPAILPWGGEL